MRINTMSQRHLNNTGIAPVSVSADIFVALNLIMMSLSYIYSVFFKESRLMNFECPTDACTFTMA